MQELKHGFGAAKMNKDADERTIPNGEYREALNIQISTSDGSDVGTMQTLLGNSKIQLHPQTVLSLSPTAKCVGSVADEQNNQIFYFVHDNDMFTDYIFHYDIGSGNLIPLVVDKYRVQVTTSLGQTATGTLGPRSFIIPDQGNSTENITNVRPGMTVYNSLFGDNINSTFITSANQIKIVLMKRYIDPTTSVVTPNWEVFMDDYSANDIFSDNSFNQITPNTVITLSSERVLNFDKLITGINIINNTLYWTDGETEPKQLHVKSVLTDITGLYHSKFLVRDEGGNIIYDLQANRIDFRENPDYIKEEHITVIKKSPLQPPTLLLSNAADFRFASGGSALLDTEVTDVFVDQNNDALSPGFIKNVTFSVAPDYKVGDVLIFRRNPDFSTEKENFEIQAELIEFSGTSGKLKIMLIKDFIPAHEYNTPESFYCTLKQEKPLYEFKFPRFAYRYKYENGQYSPYSPFSEPAFLPGKFMYKPKDGYNLGMVNTLRSLYVMDFLPDADVLPRDVIAVDIVYKESNSNNVYVVKTIDHGEDEWIARGSAINTNGSGYERTQGALLITSEMVKAAVKSNQLLRPWDNVPRTAKAQDMVGNRIVYANYLQNYNLK